MGDVQIHGRDGAFYAYRAATSAAKGPGIVVIQENFGVNKWVRGVADRLAAQGYVVYAPDLFWRQEPGIQLTDQTQAEWDRAFQLYGGFNEGKGVDDIQDTMRQLRRDPVCTGKVGTVGHCLGGKLAYLTATRTDADCAVGYYGVGIEKALDEAGNIKKPLLLHVAKADQFVPPDAQQKIHAALDGNKLVTIHDYEGVNHAFARDGGQHYNAAAAERANARTRDFFRNTLMTTATAAPKPRAAAASAAPAMTRPAAEPKPSRPTLTLEKREAAPKRPAAKRKAAPKRRAAAKGKAPAKRRAAAKARKPAKRRTAARRNPKKRGRR